MKKYSIEIREQHEGSLEPRLRTRREFCARDNAAAVAEAWKKYGDERTPGVTLINFSLYDADGNLVCEPVREDLLIPRGSRKRPVDC